MKVDVSLLQSSKKLGRVKESKKELLGRVLRESRAGIHQTGHEQILFSQQTVNSSSGSEDDVTDEDPSYEAGPSPSEVAGTIFGQGLKRLLQLDQQGKPIIRKRRRVEATIFHRQAYDEDSEWEGFISDISEHEGLQNDPLTGLNRICSDEESCDSEPGSDSQDLKSRASAFKVWATQQMNEAIGHIPSVAISEVLSPSMSVIAKNFKPRPLEEEPLPVELQVKGTNSTPQNLSHVNVQRTPSMDQARLQLPIVAEEQRIMEIIRHHDIILICGATGSGKTTQVPQFLYEAGYGNMGGPNVGLIGVTQPRRVAAVSMSKRVAQELASVAAKISYQVFFLSLLKCGFS